MSMKKSGNPVRRLRAALGLSQVEFGRLISRSQQSVRDYEAGKTPSETTVNAIKSLAVERGYAYLLITEDFAIQRIFEPAPHPSDSAAVDLHGVLDEILQSGDRTATLAVENLLAITAQYLRRPK